MDPVSLFELATTQAKWLSARQSAVASNIANINTPGYRAKDVEAFDKILNSQKFTAAGNNPGHLQTGGATGFRLVETGAASGSSSASTVSVEQELVKSSDIRAAFELNAAIVKAFHRMIMQTTKG